MRHGTQGGVNIPARCPLGFARTKPTAGRRHTVSDVYLSRIFDLKYLPCDWCLLLGGWSHIGPQSQATGLLAADTKTLSNVVTGRIKFLAACWIKWSVSQQRILGGMSDLLSATTMSLAEQSRPIHGGLGTNTLQKHLNQSKNKHGIIESLKSTPVRSFKNGRRNVSVHVVSGLLSKQYSSLRGTDHQSLRS